MAYLVDMQPGYVSSAGDDIKGALVKCVSYTLQPTSWRPVTPPESWAPTDIQYVLLLYADRS